ncbi:MAG TPA: RdgB/HAM1 family non-canonical purine NTP pyrophosphatase [Lacipirellulaceae bacterium]|nr:RdgB/HAM1 family non-canonical purine NTP pyrophosphatase [Lacipirellulaceae bacterium]
MRIKLLTTFAANPTTEPPSPPLSASPEFTLVIGTHNRKKGAELAELLAPHGLRVQTLSDFPNAIEVVEDGDSFAANAALKATQQAMHLKHWVLADDSGLAVDALRGAPGIYSARYAGPNATDDANNAKLIAELANTPLEKRTAHYVCHVTLADPTGAIRAESHDECHGRILTKPSGTNGFGYDPLFEVIEYHRTFGELGPAVKRAISHRSRALRAILPQIVALSRVSLGQ